MVSTGMIGATNPSAVRALADFGRASVARPEARRFTPTEHTLLFANTTLRNLCFFVALLALNYTLSRPSPVDFLFLLVLMLSISPFQQITANGVVLFILLFSWTLSVFVSSLSLIDNPAVAFQLVALPHVALIALSTCLVAMQWERREFLRFIRVYIFSTCVAAAIGIVGYFAAISDLLWDGRAKAFLDDPNMFAAFLVPGAFCCLYMLSLKKRRLLYAAALLLIILGILLGFSRAALGAFALWGTFWVIFLNRNNMRAVFSYVVLLSILVAAVGLIGYFFLDGVGDRLADRFTLAKDYDLGRGGRYSRYFLSLSLILDHPLGMGLFELDRFFPEPIHNIWLSSFVNYGWLAGFAWTFLVLLSVRVTYLNFKQTRDPICVLMLVSWLAILSCALLHQSERWRYFWMFAGLVWGFNFRNFLPRMRST